MTPKNKLAEMLKKSLGEDVELAEARNPMFGTYSTNVAFIRAKGRPPQEVAAEIASQLKLDKQFIEKVETKDGYINFWLNTDYIYQQINEILQQKDKFGSSNLGKGKRVLVEFVSANPTGPLNIANGRAAAIGDSLVKVLNFTGYKADAEFYVDDTGRQIDLLEASIKARYEELQGKEVEFPKDGYHGEYVKDIARELKESRKRNFRDYGVNRMVEMQKKTLEDFGVTFKKWAHESEIKKSGRPAKIVERLRQKGLVYEKEGALWLKMAQFGDDKDKVLVKSNGEFTYVVPDTAYHLGKFDRGYEWLIDLLGPDHIAHVPELKIGIKLCDYPEDKLKVVIVQWVTFIKGGKKISMSKRKGEFVALSELLDEVGKDVARFFFLTRKCESHLDFDVELAQQESKENPVYYVQYAYARISSILRLAEEKKIKFMTPELALLKQPEELFIMRKLIHFPEIVEHVATALDPHHIPFYLIDLAALFHNFYEKHKVVSDNLPLTQARLALVCAVRQVLSNALTSIGIEAPERM